MSQALPDDDNTVPETNDNPATGEIVRNNSKEDPGGLENSP